MKQLLAVDMGLRTGLALYNGEARLQWYRSHNLGAPRRLKKAVYNIFNDLESLRFVVIEGGGTLANIWLREAERRGIEAICCHATDWRSALLLARHQRTGPDAKAQAQKTARQVIAWSGLARPTSLRHDAAEAILTGLWGCHHVGWLETWPPGIDR